MGGGRVWQRCLGLLFSTSFLVLLLALFVTIEVSTRRILAG